MSIERALRALANERRLQILEWLKDPVAHFPPQVDGDLVDDGVCAVFLADKLGVSQPTLSEHMKVLTDAGLVTATRIKQWTFYRRDERRIDEVQRAIVARVCRAVRRNAGRSAGRKAGWYDQPTLAGTNDSRVAHAPSVTSPSLARPVVFPSLA